MIWGFTLEPEAIENMEQRLSGFLPNAGSTDRVPIYDSLVAGAGHIEFEFDLECTEEVYVWVLAYDDTVNQPNADSLYFEFDDDASNESDVLDYRCDTDAQQSWSWRVLERLENERDCGTAPVVPVLDAGPHTFGLLNREDGFTNPPNQVFNFAGIAAVSFSVDPEFHPNMIYDPGNIDSIPDPLPPPR